MASIKNVDKKTIAEIICTFFYLGKKHGAHIAASIIAMLLFLFILFLSFTKLGLNIIKFFCDFFQINCAENIIPFLIFTLILPSIFFIFCSYCTSVYIKYHEISNYKEIIIDKIIGQLFTFIVCVPATLVAYGLYAFKYIDLITPNVYLMVILFLIMPLILFRLFETKLSRGSNTTITIMFDDIIAGIFSAVSQVLYLLIGTYLYGLIFN